MAFAHSWASKYTSSGEVACLGKLLCLVGCHLGSLQERPVHLLLPVAKFVQLVFDLIFENLVFHRVCFLKLLIQLQISPIPSPPLLT